MLTPLAQPSLGDADELGRRALKPGRRGQRVVVPHRREALPVAGIAPHAQFSTTSRIAQSWTARSSLDVGARRSSAEMMHRSRVDREPDIQPSASVLQAAPAIELRPGSGEFAIDLSCKSLVTTVHREDPHAPHTRASRHRGNRSLPAVCSSLVAHGAAPMAKAQAPGLTTA